MDEQRTWIKSIWRMRLRIMAVILCICLLVTVRPDILAALSALATERQDNTVYVSGFGELPEAVREQTVSLGTGEEALSLPDTLEAFAVEREENPEESGEGNEKRPEKPEGENKDQLEKPEVEGADQLEKPEGEGADQPEKPEGEGAGQTEKLEGEDEGQLEKPEGEGADQPEKPEGEGADQPEKPEGEDLGESGSENGEQSGEEHSGAEESDNGSHHTEMDKQDDTPAKDEGGAEADGETAKKTDGVLREQSGVFVLPIYMAESADTVQMQTVEEKEESIMIKGVTWQSAPVYDGDVEGTYIFTALLPDGYVLSEDVNLPQIRVTVQGEGEEEGEEGEAAAENGMDTTVQELLERIAALPEAEVYLEEKPDEKEKEAYEAWMEELSAYVEEAFAIQEAYDMLTQEQQAQITEEMLAKLNAWMELAGQFIENSTMMKAEAEAEPEEAAAGDQNSIGDSGLVWKLDGGTLTISGSGSMPDLGSASGTAPWQEQLGDIIEIVIEPGVERIGGYVFKNCSKLERVTIPEGVKSIGNNAFWQCSALKDVVIPSSVTSIATSAFNGCSALESVTIPNSVTTIGNYVFKDCSALTNVDIPDSVERIGSYAFNGCSALKSVTIPESVTSIADSAFAGCNALKSVDIPNGVTSIGNSAFYSCSALESVTIPDGVTSIGNNVFDSCIALKNVTIPGEVTVIGASAFKGCSALESVTIPDSVTNIANSAFESCSTLTSVTIGKGVTTIKDSAFSGCSKLKDVTIPDSVTSVGSRAFLGCRELTSVTIGNSVESIGDSAFWGCSTLTSVDIPDNVTSVGSSVFQGCHALTSVTIGNSVESIGDSAFWGCSTLTSVTIPDNVTSIGVSAFHSCSALESVTIPDSVKSMGTNAFQGCRALTSVTIGKGVTSIERNAFQGCQALTSVTIGNSITSIESTAFSGCRALESVTIPESVTSIKEGAFDSCTKLKKIVFTGTENIPTLTTGCFNGTAAVADDVKGITVPTCQYLKVQGWSAYKDHITITEPHGLVEEAAKPATCEEEGHEAYWTCSVCGTLFSDSAGKNEIKEPTVIPAAHNLGHVDAQEPACEQPGQKEYWECSKCGKLFSDGSGAADKMITAPETLEATGHSLSYGAIAGKGITQSCEKCGHTTTAELEAVIAAPYTYTGSAIEPFRVFYPDNASAWLGENRPEIRYEDNVNAGEAKVILTCGRSSVSKTFDIGGRSLEVDSVTAEMNPTLYQYTGEAIEPAVTVRDTAIGDGTLLVKDRDYTIAYENNKEVSTDSRTAQAVITGTGNYTGTKTVYFTIVDNSPEISEGDFVIDGGGGTIKLPEDMKDKVEIYDSAGKKITLGADGSLTGVKPGDTIYIRYPGSQKETEITIPGKPAAPAPKSVTVTDTTATVSDPAQGEEYVLVRKGETPDWGSANTTGEFTGLTPDTEYVLYVRRAAAGNGFASEPASTQIRTKPQIEGEGAGKPGNGISGGKPSADGRQVTYTGTYGREYTPVIMAGGKEYKPEMIWDESSGEGRWTYTSSTPADNVTVVFRSRAYTGLKVSPDKLHIYADNDANKSADALLAFLNANCAVTAEYDNKTTDVMTKGPDYTTTTGFAPKGAEYQYTIEATADSGKITLTVSPVTATVTSDALLRNCKTGGYTATEVSGWLPAVVKAKYTGDGYETKTGDIAVTWDTSSIGADFGAVEGTQTITGTADLPAWATGSNEVSISIGFVDKNVLTDAQMTLSISGWTYGAQTAPAPSGSITVDDAEQKFTYLYSADNGASWVSAEQLPKSKGGNIIPGAYLVKMTYTGKDYTGTKTASFTVEQKPLTVEKGTLAVDNRNYDGTTNATLKEGGKPVLSGVLAGDDAVLGGTLQAVFTNKGPKKDIPVTVTGFALTGSDAGYYRLVNTTLTLQATINNADGSVPSGGSSGGNSSGSSGDHGNSGNHGNSGSSGDNDNNGDNDNSGDYDNNGDNGGGTNNSSNSGGNTGGGNGSGTITGTGGNGTITGTGSNGTITGTGGNGTITGTGSNGTITGTGGNGTITGTDGKGGNGTITGTDGKGGKGTTTGTGGKGGKGTTTGTGGKGGKGTTAGTGGKDGKGTTAGAGGKGSTGSSIGGSSKDSASHGTGDGDSGSKTEAQKTEGAAGQPGQGAAGGAEAAGQDGAAQSGNGQQTEGGTVQNVQASVHNGRIVIDGEAGTPVAAGGLTEDAPAAARLLVGNGTVIVAVASTDGKYTAGTSDAAAVANAVLTPEQIQLAGDGGNIEVRIDIKDILGSVPAQDMVTVEKGFEAYGKYVSDLKFGGYVDISVYVKTGDSGWNAVTETREPLEIVIGIPEELLDDGREYYIIRAHEGKYALLSDMDDVPETITIVTDLFSSYVIVYRQAGITDRVNGEERCGLCHICPTFLGICCLIWLAVIAIVVFVAAIIILRRRKVVVRV